MRSNFQDDKMDDSDDYFEVSKNLDSKLSSLDIDQIVRSNQEDFVSLDRINISIGKKETKPKQKHKDEVMESKHQDLFDELFGEKS